MDSASVNTIFCIKQISEEHEHPNEHLQPLKGNAFCLSMISVSRVGSPTTKTRQGKTMNKACLHVVCKMKIPQ